VLRNGLGTPETAGESSSGIRKLAEETDIQVIPFYSLVPAQGLLESISDLARATSILTDDDRAILISNEGEVRINQSFNISSDTIEELLTKSTLSRAC
jgi:hypothetical protein